VARTSTAGPASSPLATTPRPVARLSSTAPPPACTSPLSLHDALPIFGVTTTAIKDTLNDSQPIPVTIEKILNEVARTYNVMPARSEEHTSELQSRFDLVCRLLLETKNHVHAGAADPALSRAQEELTPR